MSKVWFSPSISKKNIAGSLKHLYDSVPGFDMKGRKVAVKTHFGEKGNKTRLDPEFVKKVCDIISQRGGEPELVECNTLYRGQRTNTADHLRLAREHGFDFAPVVICDSAGDWVIPVNGTHFKEIKAGKLLKNYGIIVNLSHCKAHIAAGFGGALKNIGMGLGSRAGKLEMHAKVKPVFNPLKCRACGLCVERCPADAIEIRGLKKHAVMDEEKCIGCATCIAVCPYKAVRIPWASTTAEELQERMVEYAAGISGRIKILNINFLLNITPLCDCVADSGKPMVEDIGVMSSGDMVSIDQASIDMINAKAGRDVFMEKHGIDAGVQTKYAEKMRIGETGYELVRI